MDAQIIPADTDYRMFSYKYYGSLPGVDIAFLLDSSAYHTHNDSPERIRPGTVQVCCLTVLVTASQPLSIRSWTMVYIMNFTCALILRVDCCFAAATHDVQMI